MWNCEMENCAKGKTRFSIFTRGKSLGKFPSKAEKKVSAEFLIKEKFEKKRFFQTSQISYAPWEITPRMHSSATIWISFQLYVLSCWELFIDFNYYCFHFVSMRKGKISGICWCFKWEFRILLCKMILLFLRRFKAESALVVEMEKKRKSVKHLI